MNLDPDYCKFCFSNGEAPNQYRSHKLKNDLGKVICPVLRSFVCPICFGSGDKAHTQRYCPLNQDGRYNRGASLTELKKKKNAAGNLPTRKMITLPDTFRLLKSNSDVERHRHTPSPPAYIERTYVTDPLPSKCRQAVHPMVSHEVERQKHIMQANYHRHRAMYHEDQFNKIHVWVPPVPESKPCFVRNFSSPVMIPAQFPCHGMFPGQNSSDYYKSSNVGYEFMDRFGKNSDNLLKVDPDVDELGMLLANLREGTVALDG